MKEIELVETSARNRVDMEQVYRLTYKTYLQRGLIKPFPEKRLANNQALDAEPSTVVYLAKRAERIVGSLSLSFSPHIKDVYNHAYFAEDLAKETSSGMMFSGWRLAVDTEDEASKVIVLKLIAEAVKLGVSRDCKHGFLCFLEEDLSFYQKVLPGYLVGKRVKNSTEVQATLCMWRCNITMAQYKRLQTLIKRLSKYR